MQSEKQLIKTESKPSRSIPINLQTTHQNLIHSQRDKIKTEQHDSQFLRKEVFYDNRIFNIKKKYTLPTEIESFVAPKTATGQMPKFKHSELFSKFIDNVERHKQLLRRGVCQLPLTSLLSEESRPKKRYKTDIQNIEEGYNGRKKFRSMNNSQTSTKKTANKITEIKIKDLQGLERQNPTCLSTQYNQRNLKLPIKVEKFVSKSINRNYNLSPQDLKKRKKNILIRKLDVELINYQLLGKWVNSNIK